MQRTAAWDGRRASGLRPRRLGRRGRGQRGGGFLTEGCREGDPRPAAGPRARAEARRRAGAWGQVQAVLMFRVTTLPAGFGMNRIRIHVLPTNRGRITPVPRSQEPLSCSFAHRPCSQPRLEGQEFCIKHILEDKNAPFKQCSYVSTKNGKRCPSAAPKPEKKDGYVKRRGCVGAFGPRAALTFLCRRLNPGPGAGKARVASPSLLGRLNLLPLDFHFYYILKHIFPVCSVFCVCRDTWGGQRPVSPSQFSYLVVRRIEEGR